MQLLKFGLVGGSGYAVNLAVFALLQRRSRRPSHRRRDRRLLRRRDQQLRLEPPLDLRRRPTATPASRRRASSPSASSASGFNLALLELFVTGAETAGAAGAGARRGADDAGELRRQQAVDVRRLAAIARGGARARRRTFTPSPALAADGDSTVAGSTRATPAEPDFLPPTPEDFSDLGGGGGRDRQRRPEGGRAERPLRPADDRDPGQRRRRSGRSATRAATTRSCR